MYVHLINYKRF